MATPQISKTFSFQPIPARVSKKVAEHIEILLEHGFDEGKILDVYIESQKPLNGFRGIESPMRYIRSYMSASRGNSMVRFRKLEEVYNDAVRAWNIIAPQDFLQQFDAYVHQGVNDTGLENGMIREHFLNFSLRDEKLLVIDPHPEVMAAFHKEKRDISFAFSDERFYECKSLKHPLFSLPGTRNKPITPRVLQDYFNSVLEKLDLPEYVIMILDEKKAPKRDDIDNYHGDILLRKAIRMKIFTAKRFGFRLKKVSLLSEFQATNH